MFLTIIDNIHIWLNMANISMNISSFGIYVSLNSSGLHFHPSHRLIHDCIIHMACPYIACKESVCRKDTVGHTKFSDSVGNAYFILETHMPI